MAAPAVQTSLQPTEHRMHCMEVWGGNHSVDSGVVMAGLDAWIYSRPHGGAATGGDVHYVSSCATGRITRLLLADVSGHGSAVAQIASALRELMRRYVNFIDQGRFVEAMNEQFSSTSPLETNFATAIVSTFYAPLGELAVCNAGHPPPLWYRARRKHWVILDQEVSAQGPSNVPLGILDGTNYDQFVAHLDVGDLVLCYTDSLIEARNAEGSILGARGLLALVKEVDVSEPSGFIPALLQRLSALGDRNLAEDDVTVLLFRPNGFAPRAPFAARMAGQVRFWREILRSLLPGGPPAPRPEFTLLNLGGAMFAPLARLKRHKPRD